MVSIMRRVVLHTFQRTGRNFVLNAIKDIADIWIDSSQSSNLKDFGNYDKVVTIIRNPVESIVSLALMASRRHLFIPVKQESKISVKFVRYKNTGIRSEIIE